MIQRLLEVGLGCSANPDNSSRLFDKTELLGGMDHTMDLEPRPIVLSGSHTGCWIQKTVAHDIVNRKGHILVKEKESRLKRLRALIHKFEVTYL